MNADRLTMRIGILAVQGDYEAHARMLDRLGAPYLFVRTPDEAALASAMILPGGESTTMLKFLQEENLAEPLQALAKRGGAFFGTCAGAILMARVVRSPAQTSLGLADIVIARNAYGRQLASEVRYAASTLKPEPLEMVYIRAPIIESVAPDIEVLATDGGHPVLVRQANLLMSTFHPELTCDATVHEYCLKLAEAAVQPRGTAASHGSSTAQTSSGTT
jgi:5'-phosphate synthase pdxT subunit